MQIVTQTIMSRSISVCSCSRSSAAMNVTPPIASAHLQAAPIHVHTTLPRLRSILRMNGRQGDRRSRLQRLTVASSDYGASWGDTMESYVVLVSIVYLCVSCSDEILFWVEVILITAPLCRAWRIASRKMKMASWSTDSSLNLSLQTLSR